MAYIEKYKIETIVNVLNYLDSGEKIHLTKAEESLKELAGAYHVPIPKRLPAVTKSVLKALADFVSNRDEHLHNIPEMLSIMTLEKK